MKIHFIVIHLFSIHYFLGMIPAKAVDIKILIKRWSDAESFTYKSKVYYTYY